MKLLLFDVDGTLIQLDGAGLKSLEKAFFDVFKIKNVVEKVNFAGKTDPAIYEEILNLAGINIKCLESNIKEKVMEKYLFYLDEALKEINYNPVLKGIDEYLEINSTKNDRILGLLTGNIEQGAYKKIGVGKLNKYFKIGAFGSDSKIRKDLVNIAVKRAISNYNITEIDKSDIYVIGDTPLDIKCAKDNDVISVAIATGKYSFNELQKYNPDYCLNNIMELNI